MMKPLVVAATALAATLTATIAIADAAHAAAQNTIQLDAKITAAKRVGSAGLASGELRSPTNHKKLGGLLLDCTNLPRQSGECTVTLALPAGHIAILASYGPGFSGNTTATDPIIGGTGAYRAVRGYDTESETGARTMTFTLHLVR
jgi:hypothetical protein